MDDKETLETLLRMEWNWAYPEISLALGQAHTPASTQAFMEALHALAGAIGRAGVARLSVLCEKYRAT